MSLPDVPVILSPQAEEDFADILQYTLEKWGEAQFHAYRAVLDKALLTIVVGASSLTVIEPSSAITSKSTAALATSSAQSSLSHSN